eukprot:634518-Amphidinium_carterae.1
MSFAKLSRSSFKRRVTIRLQVLLESVPSWARNISSFTSVPFSSVLVALLVGFGPVLDQGTQTWMIGKAQLLQCEHCCAVQVMLNPGGKRRASLAAVCPSQG